MKYCRVCGEEKPLDQFYRAKSAKGGHRNECKTCKTNQLYQWRNENRDRLNEYRRSWGRKNADRVREQNQKYYRENGESVKAATRKYSKQNREKINEWRRNWYKANPGKDSSYKHTRRALINKSGKFVILDKEIKRLYSNNCIHCGSKERITMDHLIPVSRGGRHSIGNIVPMCQECNFSKHTRFYSEWRYKNVRIG